MLSRYFLLILLPVLVYSSITINIRPGKTESQSTVSFSGQERAILSERERKTFKLDDETLKRASEKYKGKRCTDIYLKPPTPWGDVWRKYDWDEVERIVKPVQARILGISSKPVAVATASYVNHHHHISATYSTSVTQQVEESVGHTWSEGGELSIGQEINYNVNFGAGSVGGTTSLSYSSTWGKDTTKARTVTLGTTSAVQVTIPPGGEVETTLTATEGTMEIEVDYVATLTNGDVFCNYENTYQGHHFYAFPLRSLQKIANLTRFVRTTEKIKVGFYTNALIEVTNGTTHNEITEKPGEIIAVSAEEEI